MQQLEHRKRCLLLAHFKRDLLYYHYLHMQPNVFISYHRLSIVVRNKNRRSVHRKIIYSILYIFDYTYICVLIIHFSNK